ncbi:MAG: bifunctional UDP-N-acetylglucosamine diphosphorylase/glucosamine-1-phosphate N-acetyltransferase GlmU [Gammaproteobacteria bacterium]|nr:bifunctional UDP-N-acetylglucosamine diphosphorylase/glucosamine-1-phosphate N-acetyltransferase GlmU [Gammaproteobacteria bacterium]MDH3537198.1 bifunctional UDP-N-acetylglucosamine diphosphorylase/glucosamine-1-phosphate N-acetyltransferase GlmU [Gammaproteobacteria bacterium]
MPLSIVILAAGQGTRMKSSRPKMIHQLAGKPLLQHVVDASRALEPEQIIVVVGHGAEQVRNAMQGQDLQFVEQLEQLGTGHAVQQCLGAISAGNDVMVLVGDVPLIRAETLARMVEQGKEAAVCVLSFRPQSAFGYGRIVRDEHRDVIAIVEQKDADDDQASIGECNSGVMLIKGDRLQGLLSALDNDNAQGEYYLTDLVRLAVDSGNRVSAVICDQASEVSGVNNQQQLAAVETLYRARQAEALMSRGVKLFDPARVDIRGEIDVGHDVEIDVNCVFEGTVSLGNNVRIGANCVIRNASIADDSVIHPMTWIDEAVIGRGVSIGPFARIRAGTELDDSVKIGNFVETKKSRIGKGSKVSHLSYIGDTEMGGDVNIGAGTITCNYDGVNKFRTVIEDGVFIGSDTQLVAPVRVGRNATIGAGSTITKNAPADKLTISRAKQVTIDAWSKPVKKDT